jgi:hypothetical protein
MPTTSGYGFFRRNGLSIVLAVFFAIFLIGQILTGYAVHNGDREDHGLGPLSLADYLTSGHFLSAMFENWESEFLQMGMYVLLTIWLYQLGSSESKKIDEEEEVDREPKPSPDAPWPVRKGGIWLLLYRNSLSLAFMLLFLVSMVAHFFGSTAHFNDEQMLEGKPLVSYSEHLASSHFWFESFQNWQSEFLAVLSIVLLSIFLRQQGSPESKPVDAKHTDTGSG